MVLLEILRFRLRMLLAALTIKPIAGGSPEGDEGGEGEGEGKGEGEGEGAGAGGEGEGGEGEPDWKSESRKHERRAKQEKKAREQAEAKLQEKAEANQSEQEKALEQARKEARDEAVSEGRKERRTDRLEAAVTRHAAKGVKVGEDTVRFADAEDALVHVERAVRAGDIDEDDIFDGEDRVQTDALVTALTELLERKPHLKDAGARPAGESDAGKGSASKEANVTPGLGRLRHAYSDN